MGELKKPTKNDINRIKTLIYDYHVWGFNLFQIKHYLQNGGFDGSDEYQWFNIPQNRISKLLKEVTEEKKVQNAQELTKSELLEKSKERWETFIRNCREKGSWENVRLAQKELDKLNGLDVQQIDMKVTGLSKMTDEELLAEINKYQNK